MALITRRLAVLLALALAEAVHPSLLRSEPPAFWYSSFAIYTQDGGLQEVALPARQSVGSDPLSGRTASVSVPDQGVEFGPNVKSAHSILVEGGESKTVCGQVSQDVGYALDGAGNRTTQLPLLGFEGCPLVVGEDLEPVAGMEARQRNEIVVESSTGPVLQVVGSRFFATDGRRLLGGCEMLPNTVWVFRKKGLVFETKSHRFSVEQDGATIAFTRGGVVLTGVRRVRK
jgi:hypothetical protein